MLKSSFTSPSLHSHSIAFPPSSVGRAVAHLFVLKSYTYSDSPFPTIKIENKNQEKLWVLWKGEWKSPAPQVIRNNHSQWSLSIMSTQRPMHKTVWLTEGDRPNKMRTENWPLVWLDGGHWWPWQAVSVRQWVESLTGEDLRSLRNEVWGTLSVHSFYTGWWQRRQRNGDVLEGSRKGSS